MSNHELFRKHIIDDLGYDPGEIRVTERRGKPIRFSTSSDPQDGAGWYRFYGEYGSYGNWRDENKTNQKWSSGRKLSEEAKQELDTLFKADKAALSDQYIIEAAKVREFYSGLKYHTTSAHPYLEKKGIRVPHGIFVHEGKLVVPLYDRKGKLVNVQFIAADGRKTFWKGADSHNLYHQFGNISDKLILSEGFATSATLHEALNLPVVMAVSAHYLSSIAQHLRKKYPAAEIIIAADDDVCSNNIGEKKARAAAEKTAAKISLPPFVRPPNDKDHSDWNDYARVNGIENVAPAFEESLKDPTLDHTTRNIESLREGTTPPSPELVAEINSTFFFTNDNGKCLVYEELDEVDDDGSSLRAHTTEDFCKMFRNRYEFVDGKKVRLGDYWLDHPARRQYLKGVIFDPRNKSRKGYYNLFKGYAVEPDNTGSWDLMREHILNIICDGKTEHFEYLMNWMARGFQRPWEKGETIVVLRGEEGSGKGILGNALLQMFGEHAMHVTQAQQLVGQYNGHLRNKLYIFADEAFFAGDKKHVNVLKSLATESETTYEFKYRNPTRGKNYLHILMASNEAWVVPASENDRRFFVLDVKNTQARNSAYFDPISQQLKAGGWEAMLDELMKRDISSFNVRDIPKTSALDDQKLWSMSVEDSWWYDVLNRGYILESEFNTTEFFEWQSDVATSLLEKSYREFARSQRAYKPLTRNLLGKYLKKIAGRSPSRFTNTIISEKRNADGSSMVVRSPVGKQVYGYTFGTLEEARKRFQKMHNRTLEWDDDVAQLEFDDVG